MANPIKSAKKRSTPTNQSNTGIRTHVVNLNNYDAPSTQFFYQYTGEYIFNGDINRYFKYLERRYIGSTTHAAVVDDIADLIYGLGLLLDGESIEPLISSEDLKDFIKDHKLYGHGALEVIYSNSGKVHSLNYMDIKGVAIKTPSNLNAAPTEFWYCFDWEFENQFPPVKIPAFGKTEPTVDEEGNLVLNKKSELLVTGLKNRFPYFRVPDYQASLQYAQVEEEVSNFSLQWIENGLSLGHIINVVRGITDDLETQAAAERKITQDLTGSNGKRFVLSFNDNVDQQTTVTPITNDDEFEKYSSLANEAEKKILLSHGFYPILLGLDKATGFSNNAEEMNTALRLLYRRKINPFRDEIIKALTKVVQINNPNAVLSFVDFNELAVAEVSDTVAIPPTTGTTETNTQLITE